MRNIYFIIFILVLITTITRVAENQDTNKQHSSFKLFDGGKSGIINSDDTKASLVAKFGMEALNDESIWIDEGTIEVKVTRLLKDSTPVTIYWDNDLTVSKVIIDEPNSAWEVCGITCGASIQELLALNKTKISFYGFGWDQGGLVTDWHDGELADQLKNTKIELGLDWDFIDENNINPDKFMGDSVILDSDNHELDTLHLKVTRIVLQF